MDTHTKNCSCEECRIDRAILYGPAVPHLVAQEILEQEIIESYWEPRNAAEFHRHQCYMRGELHLKLVVGGTDGKPTQSK